MKNLVLLIGILTINGNLVVSNVLPLIGASLSSTRWIPTATRAKTDPVLKQGTVQSYSTYQPLRQINPASMKDVKFSSGQTMYPNAAGTDLRMLPEPMPRMDETIQKKQGFLSSLLPTSLLTVPQQNLQDEDNLVGVDTEPQGYQVSKEPAGLHFHSPAVLPYHSGQHDDVSAPFNEAVTTDDAPSLNDEEHSDGLFSRFRQVLFPFGSGLLSGLLEKNETVPENIDSYALTSNLEDPHFLASSTLPSVLSNFNLLPQEVHSAGEDETYDNPVPEEPSLLPNPFTFLKSIFHSFKLPENSTTDQNLDIDKQDDPSEDASEAPSEDSSMSPLESLADGGFDGVLGLIVPVIAQLASTLGIAAANIPALTLLGSVIGPIIAAAIAGIVIGIVYVSFYVAAATVKNQGVDGELVILSYQQLANILGLEDTIDDIFGRSFHQRSLSSFPTISTAPFPENHCIERVACRVLGTKILSPRKTTWISTSLQWMSKNVNPDQITSITPKSLSPTLRKGKAFIDAIVAGLDNSDTQEPCGKYNCNLISTVNNKFN